MNSIAFPALNSAINTRNDLLALARLNASDLKANGFDPYCFLVALMTVESSFGIHNRPRFELSYSRSSIAFKRSVLLQAAHEAYGDLAACSYSACQILYIVAAELGFTGHPLELWNTTAAMPYVIKLLNRLVLNGADSLEKLAAAYNAGLGCLKNKDTWPLEYVNKLGAAYMSFKNDQFL